jgi:regulator of sigma E protease
VTPRYDELRGLRVIGLWPPRAPVVTDLTEMDGIRPAQQAGIELGDRVVSVNGKAVMSAEDVERELAGRAGTNVDFVVRRGGDSLRKTIPALDVPQYVLGISATTTKVARLRTGGPGADAGLRPHDVITAVNGRPVASSMGLREALLDEPGTAVLTVERGAEQLEVTVEVPDEAVATAFEESIWFYGGPEPEPAGGDPKDDEPGVVMAWVEEGGPAWEAGLRPGDSIVRAGGADVEEWRDILVARARARGEPCEIAWLHDGELKEAAVQPVAGPGLGGVEAGFRMETQKSELRRYGVMAAIGKGMQNTKATIREILMMLRGMGAGRVSPKQMGGIVTISVASYHAASAGMGQLLYLTAVISASIAFLNILPIPVLDGGHLMFLLIEKIRGRRVGERALAIAQAVGFALLMLLVIYVTGNDIMRLIR